MRIKVKFELEGIHRWEECPIEEVSYLRNDHRHHFGIVAYKLIDHDNRDIEFIELQHQMKNYLKEQYWSTNHQCLYFGKMSCEMIARELILQFNLSECEVNEDGENGAILNQEDTGPNIWIICGEFCSGKTTLSNELVEKYKTHKTLRIGDLVREITNVQNRSHILSLDTPLIKELKDRLRIDRNLIIDGIRQLTILQAVIQFCKKKKYTYQLKWIETPQDIRMTRFYNRQDIKDTETFSKYEDLEKQLGIQEVKNFIKNQ